MLSIKYVVHTTKDSQRINTKQCFLLNDKRDHLMIKYFHIIKKFHSGRANPSVYFGQPTSSLETQIFPSTQSVEPNDRYTPPPL